LAKTGAVVAIELHAVDVARHQEAHKLLRLAIAGLARDDDLLNFFAVKITNRPFDERAFFVHKRRRARCERGRAHGFPHPQQILEVALDLGLSARGAGSAENNAHALRNVEFFGDRLQSAPVLGIGDLARNAAAARRVGHQNRIPPSKRKVGRQRRSLVAALFFDNLHKKNLPPLDDLLNFVLTAGALRATWNLF